MTHPTLLQHHNKAKYASGPFKRKTCWKSGKIRFPQKVPSMTKALHQIFILNDSRTYRSWCGSKFGCHISDHQGGLTFVSKSYKLSSWAQVSSSNGCYYWYHWWSRPAIWHSCTRMTRVLSLENQVEQSPLCSCRVFSRVKTISRECWLISSMQVTLRHVLAAAVFMKE